MLRLGLAPHAPYSAGPGIYKLAGELGVKENLTLTTHLAETCEEIEFLANGGGEWAEYLKRVHHWDGSFMCPGKRPVEYFLGLETGGRQFLLAHVNYINDRELEALAQTNHSVVFCPRSHDFFGHKKHRFTEMIEVGINVCLGTDSLASNSSLSMLDEIRFLHGKYPQVPGETILKMATINGATGLNWDDKIGSVEKGKFADLIAIALTGRGKDAMSDILESTEQPRLTMVAGNVVFEGII